MILDGADPKQALVIAAWQAMQLPLEWDPEHCDDWQQWYYTLSDWNVVYKARYRLTQNNDP